MSWKDNLSPKYIEDNNFLFYENGEKMNFREFLWNNRSYIKRKLKGDRMQRWEIGKR